jgi:SAM-dependent methyltransferase
MNRIAGTTRRSAELVREQYEIERELALRLKRASRAERRVLYPALYDELFRRVRHHPMLEHPVSAGQVRETVAYQLRMLAPFIDASTVFLEIGPGDCSLSIEMASRVKKVYAVDVSAELAGRRAIPANLELAISDGTSIPVPPGAAALAYSNQLMEHLHPEDAEEQLRNIFAALAPGGRYVCVTPNRLTGPHDVSRFFDRVATGFHLHEYTVRELRSLMLRVGFKRVHVYVYSSRFRAVLTAMPVIAFERLLSGVPYRLRHALAENRIVEKVLGVNLIAVK